MEQAGIEGGGQGHGHTVRRQPTITPISAALVAAGNLRKQAESTRLKVIRPAMPPAMNTASTSTRKSTTAFKMYWYCPRITRMNEPEIPGSIMAQSAMKPAPKR